VGDAGVVAEQVVDRRGHGGGGVVAGGRAQQHRDRLGQVGRVVGERFQPGGGELVAGGEVAAEGAQVRVQVGAVGVAEPLQQVAGALAGDEAVRCRRELLDQVL